MIAFLIWFGVLAGYLFTGGCFYAIFMVLDESKFGSDIAFDEYAFFSIFLWPIMLLIIFLGGIVWLGYIATMRPARYVRGRILKLVGKSQRFSGQKPN